MSLDGPPIRSQGLEVPDFPSFQYWHHQRRLRHKRPTLIHILKGNSLLKSERQVTRNVGKIQCYHTSTLSEFQLI